jgi:hypothetical protein
VTNLLDGFALDVSRDHKIGVLSLPRLFASGDTRAWIQWGTAALGSVWRVNFRKTNS